MKALSPTQLDGCACVACGASNRPMVVVPDVETRSSTHLFRCDRVECAVDPTAVHRRIPASERAPAYV